MAEIRTVTTLRYKRDEILASIKLYERQLEQAKADSAIQRDETWAIIQQMTVFISLAIEHDSQFVTADGRLLRILDQHRRQVRDRVLDLAHTI